MKHKNKRLAVIVFCSAAVISILIVWILTNRTSSDIEMPPPPTDKADSFVFFNLGRNTLFNETIRRTLTERLGPDRVETWSPISLEMHEPGFIAKHFPVLDEMNRRLNINNGLDIGEHTIKVTYRYAMNQELPFYYIKFVFSDFTRRPLYFRIKMKLDGQYVVDTIREKYGTPEIIHWGEQDNFTLFWEKDGDIMTISKVENRIGEPEYQIMIYYLSNLQNLLRIQKDYIQKQTEEKTETGKSAF
jgi:hypothetical protein